MKCSHPWEILASAMPEESASLVLAEFKSYHVVKSDKSQCRVCMLASPHPMRTRRLECACTCFAETSPYLKCPWRARVQTCLVLNQVTVEVAYRHTTPVAPPPKPSLTPAMKTLAWEWASQGLKPKRIWMSLMERFNLTKNNMPELKVVQRVVNYHVNDRLGGSDLHSVVSIRLEEKTFSGDEEETTPFTCTWRADRSGNPVAGNGSDMDPFIVGMTTMSLLRQADRDPSTFILHVNATYKLSQVGYPVIVVGISDRARQFHLLGLFIVSQLQEPHHVEVLSLLRRTYVRVTGKPMRIRYAMGDADRAQWNALQNVFGPDNSFHFLMCYFHVAKKVYEKTRTLAPGEAASVLADLNELHFTVSELEFRSKLADIQAKWARSTSLRTFSAYFSEVWLNDRVWRWQCYHTPSGFAATNKFCETFNAAIKRDTTLRRRLKMGALIDQLLVLC